MSIVAYSGVWVMCYIFYKIKSSLCSIGTRDNLGFIVVVTAANYHMSLCIYRANTWRKPKFVCRVSALLPLLWFGHFYNVLFFLVPYTSLLIFFNILVNKSICTKIISFSSISYFILYWTTGTNTKCDFSYLFCRWLNLATGTRYGTSSSTLH
jgi:hypothetical protein